MYYFAFAQDVVEPSESLIYNKKVSHATFALPPKRLPSMSARMKAQVEIWKFSPHLGAVCLAVRIMNEQEER
jgi:hypothetical protein